MRRRCCCKNKNKCCTVEWEKDDATPDHQEFWWLEFSDITKNNCKLPEGQDWDLGGLHTLCFTGKDDDNNNIFVEEGDELTFTLKTAVNDSSGVLEITDGESTFTVIFLGSNFVVSAEGDCQLCFHAHIYSCGKQYRDKVVLSFGNPAFIDPYTDTGHYGVILRMTAMNECPATIALTSGGTSSIPGLKEFVLIGDGSNTFSRYHTSDGIEITMTLSDNMKFFESLVITNGEYTATYELEEITPTDRRLTRVMDCSGFYAEMSFTVFKACRLYETDSMPDSITVCVTGGSDRTWHCCGSESPFALDDPIPCTEACPGTCIDAALTTIPHDIDGFAFSLIGNEVIYSFTTIVGDGTAATAGIGYAGASAAINHCLSSTSTQTGRCYVQAGANIFEYVPSYAFQGNSGHTACSGGTMLSGGLSISQSWDAFTQPTDDDCAKGVSHFCGGSITITATFP